MALQAINDVGAPNRAALPTTPLNLPPIGPPPPTPSSGGVSLGGFGGGIHINTGAITRAAGATPAQIAALAPVVAQIGRPSPPPAPHVTPPPGPSAPPPPPGGGGGGNGGGNPYDSDPGYQAALAQEQLGLSSSNQALNNLIQQRITAYGDPSLAAMAGFGLDPQAAAFARQNYLTGNAELARIDRQHKNNLQAIINQLAGRGLIFSGDTGYQTGNEDQNYGNTVYDAQQKALADILGYRTQTLQQQQQMHQAVIDALQTAYQNYLNHPELGGYGQPAAAAATPSSPAGNYQYGTAAQVASALKKYTAAQRKNMGYYG